jgi:hypothetical protein
MTGRLIALVLAAALAGCAQYAEERRNAPIAGESLASSVMRAGGIQGPRDARTTVDSAMSAQSLGAVTGDDVIGAGQILTGGLTGALQAFTGPTGRPDDVSHIFAWPPADYAPTAVEAQRRFWEELTGAIRDAMAVAGPDAEFTTRTGEARIPFGTTPGYGATVQWHISACDRLVRDYCAFNIATNQSELPQADGAPSFLNEASRWAFRRDDGAISFRPLGQTDDFPPRRLAVVDEMTFYEAISRNLPDWAFIYVAPFTAGYIPAGSDRPAFYAPPVVLNQGLAYYFVEGQREGVPLIRDFRRMAG